MKIEYYWSANASSYAEAKNNGALRTWVHDHLDSRAFGEWTLHSSMAADFREIVEAASDMFGHNGEVRFFLFDDNDKLVDAL